MEFTVEQLEAWLEMLRDMGIEEFEGLGFHVRFSTNVPQVESVDKRRPVPPPKTNFEHPSLWPGGELPKFPNKDR